MRALALALALLFLSVQPQPAAQSAGTIAIDATKPGPAIPANMYGIFFEEISHAGDGGLYAELIQNRGFEDSRLPPMSTLENGFVVPERTPTVPARPEDVRRVSVQPRLRDRGAHL